MRRVTFALVCALLLSIGFLSPAPAAAQQTSLTIAVSCATDPEQVTITNNLATTLNVVQIGSLDDPGTEEVVSLPNSGLPSQVPVGQSITYTAGSDATGNVLVRENIFDDEEDDEGVRVSIGPEGITGQTGPQTFDVLCREGSRTFTFGAGTTATATRTTPAAATATRATTGTTTTTTAMPSMPSSGAGGGRGTAVPGAAFVLLAGALAAAAGTVALRRRRA